jgi:hypothetical protein
MSSRAVVRNGLAMACLAAVLSAQTKTVPIDLSPSGLKAAMAAPEGATAKAFLSTIRVAKPTHFSVEITPEPIYPIEFGAAKDAAKTETQAVFRVDSPDTIVWESNGPAGARSSHFYTTVKLGAKVHACSDTRGSGDFTPADVDAMLAACRTLKAK